MPNLMNPPPRLSDTSPAYSAVAVTPSDALGFAPCRALWVGGSGDLSVVMVGDTEPVLLKGARLGMLLPLSITRVMATGTTATYIVALY